MASAESLLISAVITSGSKKDLGQANFTSDNMAKYKDHMFFILESRNVPSRKAFKAKFPSFIVQIIPPSDIPNLVKQCKENKIKSDLSKSLIDAANLMKGGEDPKKILAKLEKETRIIDSQFGNTIDIEVMSNLPLYANNYLEKRSKISQGKTIGIPYGIPTMDRLTGGLQNKELVTIAARTKVGKTWIQCKLAASALMSGFSPLYLSLEMDWDAIANRIFSIISYEFAIAEMKAKGKKSREKYLNENVLQNNELNLGKLSEKKVGKILKKIRNNIKSNLFVPDIRGKFSIGASQRRIEILQPDLVFFDYFGLTQQAGSSKGVDNWVQAAEASKLAKEIARTYDIPYILGAQLNRTGAQADSPKLEHISLTDSIGQDSDKVFMLKSLGRRNTIELICEKFRGSFDGWKLRLAFDVNLGRLVEKEAIGVNSDEEGDF